MMEETEENHNMAEAERLLGIAEKLLQARDLNSTRDFAILSQEADPLLEGPDQILAVVDVILTAEKRLAGDHNDWYAVLQIEDRGTSDLDLIKAQYRRLALLLHPDKNKHAFADQAFRLITEAWAVLSNASTKAQYDSQINNSAAFFKKVDLNQQASSRQPVRQGNSSVSVAASPVAATGVGRGQSMTTFWTTCPYCYVLYEYPKVYVECCVRCQKCRRSFHAARIPQLPPLVPGKDAYYCSWGFFPMGFSEAKEDDKGEGQTETAAAKFPSWMPEVFAAQKPVLAAGQKKTAASGPRNDPGRQPVFPAGQSIFSTGQQTVAESGPRSGAVGGGGAGQTMARVVESPGVSVGGRPVAKKRGRPRKNPVS